MFTEGKRHGQAVPWEGYGCHAGKDLIFWYKASSKNDAEYPRKEDNIDGRDICKEESEITETVVLSGPYSSDLPKLDASRD